MKALILAGGAGTRLRPITHTRAKQFVPVANTPILFYGIRSMVAAGITEIGVIIGDTGPEVREALGDGSQFGAAITYIPQDAPFGLAHCVLIARDFLGDDDFVMYLGDNLLEQDLSAFVEAFETAAPRRPAAGGADPAQAGSGSASLRDRHARRGGSRRASRREAGRSAVGSGARGRVPVRPDHPRSSRRHRAVAAWRARDHRRHPVADRSGSPGALRTVDGLVDRHRQADAAAWRPTACCSSARSGASTAPSTSARTSRVSVVIEVGAEIVNSTVPRAGGHRSQHPGRRQLHRPVQRDRQRLRGRQQRGRALGRHGRLEGARHPPARRQPDRSGGRGRPAPRSVPARCA